MSKGLIIGLTGPSGVGKGIAKKCIREAFPELVELTVVTTRKKRVTDGLDRETEVPVGLFLEGMSNGEIIFSHQPFGNEGDWYGFRRSQTLSYLSQGKHILTEIHVDNLQGFKKEYGESLFLIGLVSNTDYLKFNLDDRDSETPHERNIRLQAAISETERIRQLAKEGFFYALVEMDFNSRNNLEAISISLTDEIIEHKRRQARKETN
jgi:guanylate kinase